MPRSLSKSRSEDFEPKKKNPLGLLNDSNLDSHLKSLKIGEKNTPIQLSDDEIRFDADFSLNGKFKSHSLVTDNQYLDIKAGDDGYIQFSAEGSSVAQLYPSGTSTYWLLDNHEYHYLDSPTANYAIYARESGGSWRSLMLLNAASNSLSLFDDADTGDKLVISVNAAGASSITTTDDDGTAAHLTLQPDGDLYLDPVSRGTKIFTGDKLFFDGDTETTFIFEKADDELTFSAGGDYMLSLDEANDKIVFGASNWVAGTVSGSTVTEFSATNSAYAGMILGYTRLEGDLTSSNSFEIQNALTVEDSTHQITFKTPPSELVEIEATVLIDILSTDTEVHVGLSDNSTYNKVGEQFEYDVTGLWFSDDEASDKTCVAKWVLGASQLASVGSSNTFYIGFSTAGLTKTAYVKYGLRASHSVADHPFVIKATALPATIYDGQ